MNLTDWIVVIAVVCIVFGASVISVYIVLEDINSCTSDPLQYALDEVNEVAEFNTTYSYLEMSLYISKDDVIPIKIVGLELNS